MALIEGTNMTKQSELCELYRSCEALFASLEEKGSVRRGIGRVTVGDRPTSPAIGRMDVAVLPDGKRIQFYCMKDPNDSYYLIAYASNTCKVFPDRAERTQGEVLALGSDQVYNLTQYLRRMAR